MRIWPYPPVLFLLMVLALHACREKDERFPSILIAQPGNGASYQVFDTVTVVYTASDETQLESVIGQLLDQNLIPIGPQVFADVVGNAFSGSFELVISDKLTPSGNYFIMVKAFDGTNEQREFVEIQIQAMPKLRRAVYAATAVQQSATIWKVDSLFQQAELWTSAGQDVLGLHVNSLEDRLSIAGRYSTALSTYSILSRTVVWNDQTFPLGQTERYTYLHGFKNTLYAGLYDRELRAYTSNGALTLIRPTGDFRPETIYADDTYLLVEMNLVGDDRHLIYVYNTLTMALLWQSEFPMDIVAICPLQQDEVLVFGNDNGQARVFHFDVGSNGFWEPRQLPSGKLLDAVKLNGPQFAISHGNGIYAYTYSPNYMNLIASGNVYQHLNFDVDNGTIVAASGNLLQQLTVAGQTVGTIALSDSIVGMDIHYTR